MFRLFVFFNLFVFTFFGFSQQNTDFRITGRIPRAESLELYRVQVGAFLSSGNAQGAYDRLNRASLNPVFERYNDFTRVLIPGVRAGDIPFLIERIKAAGFNEVYIRIDNISAEITRFDNSGNTVRPIEQLPVSTAALPPAAAREIAFLTIRTGETRNLNDITEGRNVTSWTSSTPSTIQVDENGNLTALNIGNGFISINESEYISIAVVPQEDFYVVPESMSSLLPPQSRTSGSSNLTEYRTEPTFRLSYRFVNKGESRGASGGNGGIDILGRGADYEWLWTTFFQGGWFYDLNGIRREMINGYQRDANGVSLTVRPEFVYDKGVPYLQLRHILQNTNNFAVTGQRFGASADVMIHNNDEAPLLLTSYGAYMTDSASNPSLELMFVCLSGDGIDPVDTLWLGTWSDGRHLNYIYEDRRVNVFYSDSAIGFSYQNIDLGPGESKEYVVRFTLARHEE
jgi:hypothetical protein